MTEKKKIIFSICLSISLLIIIGIYTYIFANRYKVSTEWVSHTHQVISQAEKLLSDVQKVESADRGYVIVSDENSINHNEDNQKDIEYTYSFLRKLVSDNPPQVVLLDSIKNTINLKIAYLNYVVSERKKGFENAQKLMATGIGQREMSKINTSINNFIDNENILLAERIKLAKKDFLVTAIVIFSSILLTLVILIAFMYFFIKGYNTRVFSQNLLQQSEKKFADIFRSSPLAIVITNLETGKIQNINDEYTTMFGFTREEVKDRSMVELGCLSLEDRALIIKQVKANGSSKTREFNFRTKFGDIITCLYSNIIINIEETPSIIAMFSNITELKKIEAELVIAKEKAEESSHAKEAFVANMSHEIRTPMNAILGFTDLLLKRDLQEPEKEKLRIIKSSGENLLQIINNVLDVSKIESGMIVFEEHPISIKELLLSLEAMFHIKAKEKNINLSFLCEDKIPNVVLGDSTSLTGIIINLVNNAIKFTNPEGNVDVIAKMLDEKDESYRIEFSIKDTGIGIAEDKIQHVFERFTQAEAYTTRKYGGTGLGLNIAKQLVAIQGGKLTVESKVGLGSIFTFILPFKKTDQVLSIPKDTIDANLSKINKLIVLITEDNPINIKFITTLFTDYNLIKPDIAKDGKEAIEKIKNNHYDLILMDIEMPEMNGYEVTQTIRVDLKNNVPIIAMTAHAMAGEEEKCLKLGMNGFISKPIRANTLFEKMYAATTYKTTNKVDNMQNGKLLNLDFLIKSMNGKKEPILEIIDISLQEIPEDMAIINKAVAKTEQATIKSRAHRMKSTVSVLGISSITKILEEMQVLGADANGMERIKTLNQSLNLLSEQAMQEMQAERVNFI